ncbi:MAG TPA: UDP-N-acetylglucosamine 2-epimerase (non-hydrolyzing) [Vicinamibacteria bacterium]|nr:UDP-N-acetylglucosamine 2-epimerase (non-hydrolyzing) [Vicinamibacteria bacterium]
MTAPALAVLLGTRPEAIKLSPVIRALATAGAPPLVVVTGQHDEMLQPILQDLGIVPAENLEVMSPAQGLASLSARVLEAVDALLARHPLRTVIVQGDTTSAVMAGLAAFYRAVRVAHVEAGLRTNVPRNPFPEEMNRRLLARVADLHFAPTEAARRHLLDEGVAASSVHLVGNTVVDALFDARDRLLPGRAPDDVTGPLIASGRRIVLLTAHRRESFGEDLRAIGEGVRALARDLADDVAVAYPLHLNPEVSGPMRDLLGHEPGVHLLPPLPYLSFLRLLLASTLVITDSGGVQEEATALGKPFLVVRKASERLEAVDAGVGELVGTDAGAIAIAASRLLRDDALYARRAVPSAVFGDGRAAERIAAVLVRGASAGTAGPPSARR